MRSRLDRVTFSSEAAAIAARNPHWSLCEIVDDVFNQRSTYLEAEFSLSPYRCSSSIEANDMDNEFESEEDTERISSSGPAKVDRSEVRVKLLVSYSESYRLPQVHFDLLLPVGETEDVSARRERVFLSVDELQHRGMRGICDAEHDGSGLIVALGYCEELQRGLYSVHQCDTSALLSTAREMNVVNGRGSCLQLVLMMIGTMLGAPCSLTHD